MYEVTYHAMSRAIQRCGVRNIDQAYDLLMEIATCGRYPATSDFERFSVIPTPFTEYRVHRGYMVLLAQGTRIVTVVQAHRNIKFRKMNLRAYRGMPVPQAIQDGSEYAG